MIKSSLQRTPWLVVAVFLLPSFIGFLLFMAVPIIAAFGISLTNFSGGPNFRFIGLTNYVNAFTSSTFLKFLSVTVNFTLWTVLAQLSLGLVFSLILDSKREPVNQFLLSLGLPAPLWLAGEKTALPTIIMVTVWQNFGYYMVLFLGGLQTISSTLYEAAAIDGAGPGRRFLSVTIPGLSPIIFFSVTIAIIRAFQVFDQIFVMTGGSWGGGPAGATNVLVFDIYKNGFIQFRFGYAAAESVALLLIILAVTLIQQQGQKKWVSYDIV
jgi:ABC-type sugar transport system permease subunit